MDVVVVGAGLAGLRTAQELRAQGHDGGLVVVGEESHRPYDRPPLSKALPRSASEPTWLEHDLGVDLDDLADEVVLGSAAVALHPTPAGAEVEVEGGRRLAGSAVVLACGAVPVVPPALPEAWVLRTLDDARRLAPRLLEGSPTRAVVVGAGWIGAELASVAAGRGWQVTVLEVAAHPLASAVGSVGARTAGWYADAGVDLRTAVPAEDVPAVVRSSDPEVLVAATGVRPATRWLEGAVERHLTGAVLVDAVGRASAPGVFAVGDCAARWSPRYGRHLPGGHWTAALREPAAVAAAVLGRGARPADEPPYVFSTQFGRELGLVGVPDPAADVVLRGDLREDGRAWSAAWVRDGVLVALLGVDRPRDVAQARRALGNGNGAGVAVDATVLRDPARAVRDAVRAGAG